MAKEITEFKSEVMSHFEKEIFLKVKGTCDEKLTNSLHYPISNFR